MGKLLTAVWQWLERFRIVRIIARFVGEMGKRNVGSNAAGISFYFFISIIPFFILLCSQLPFTGISRDTLIQAATQLTPDTLDALVESIITEAYTSRVALFSVSLLALLWSSSKVVTATIRALDMIYQEDDKRNFFVITGRALLYTAILLLGSGILLIALTKGQTAEQFLVSLLPTREIFRVISKYGHNLLLLFSVSLLFALMYTLLPAGRRNYFFQLPGALVAGFALGLFSGFFALHYAKRNVYSSFYGSLANIAILLLWLYTCVNMFLIGAVFNSIYKQRIQNMFRRRSKEPAEPTIEE